MPHRCRHAAPVDRVRKAVKDGVVHVGAVSFRTPRARAIGDLGPGRFGVDCIHRRPPCGMTHSPGHRH